jgi:ribosomal-protein-alanine N-acetyltransferase
MAARTHSLSCAKLSDMFPEALQTTRLTFRPIAPADAASIFDGYAQDAVVSKFLTWRPHQRIADTEGYIARCKVAPLAKTYVLVGRSDERVLGAFDLRRTGPSRVGYGYVLARSEWGKGLMTEALTEAARWTLSQDDVWRFGDVCDVENSASARVMEKAGLAREGILRRWAIHPNVSEEPRDCFSFAMVR